MGGESLLMVSLNICFVFGVKEMGLLDLTFLFQGLFFGVSGVVVKPVEGKQHVGEEIHSFLPLLPASYVILKSPGPRAQVRHR